MTVSHLQSAFAGESQAHMRYMVYADKARKDGFPNVGRLFDAIAWAEQIHASSHFVVMRNEVGDAITTAGAGFGLGPTAQNLGVAIGGEDFEVAEMYPVYKAAAEFQQERGAIQSFDWAWQAEKTHSALYKLAKEAVEAGNDYAIGTLHVCSRCGHTTPDGLPDQCPICKAKPEMYRAFE
jgi:rubrerythrin